MIIIMQFTVGRVAVWQARWGGVRGGTFSRVLSINRQIMNILEVISESVNTWELGRR